MPNPERSEDIARLHEAGQYSQLRDYCDALLDTNPTDVLALQNGAMARLHLKLYEEALAYCDRVLEIEQEDPYALHNAAYALEHLHRHAEALERCNIMLKGDPRDIWALNSAGLALSEMGRSAEASEYFGRVLKLDPHNPTALMNGALALEYTGHTSEAIALYNRALRLNPPAREAAGARERAYRSLGMENEAFLAAQGISDDDMKGIILRAHNNRCSLLHQLCLDEIDGYAGADPHAKNPFRSDI